MSVFLIKFDRLCGMIYFATYAHAQYAKNMCKSHSLLRSQETIVDFFPNPQQPNIPPSPSQQSKKALSPDPSFPPKQFESQKFQDPPHSFRYPQESQEIHPPPVNQMRHSSIVHHPQQDSSNKMFLYKSENPSSLVNPVPIKPGTKFPEHEPTGFRPNRSRPSFSDNASLELLYSFFSSLNI